ncbi:MAG: hypothetical protein RLZZ356_1569, partial [Verrucomicrobiota bacterium]
QHTTTVEANRTNPKRDLLEVAGFEPDLDRTPRLDPGVQPGVWNRGVDRLAVGGRFPECLVSPRSPDDTGSKP